MSTSKSKLISPSPSSPSSLRQFRQQAIPVSLFSESRASYGRGSDIMLKSPTASVSLSVFLNRKLATNNILGRGSVKDKKTCFASIGGIQRVGGGNYEGGPLDRDIFQKLNSFRKEEDRKDLNVLKEPSQLELENNKQDNCKSGSKKRGNPFADKSIDRPSSSKYLHVLGDDPKPMWNAIKKKKVERKREPIYNHCMYAKRHLIYQMPMEVDCGAVIGKELTLKKWVAMKHGKEWDPPLWEVWNGIEYVGIC